MMFLNIKAGRDCVNTNVHVPVIRRVSAKGTCGLRSTLFAFPETLEIVYVCFWS